MWSVRMAWEGSACVWRREEGVADVDRLHTGMNGQEPLPEASASTHSVQANMPALDPDPDPFAPRFHGPVPDIPDDAYRVLLTGFGVSLLIRVSLSLSA